MAGYIRQSSFSDGDTITAALFNNEYNQILNAFSNTSGHAHDGTAAEGPVIGLIGDAGETAPNNKVLIDTTNNYIEFYVQVSSSPVQQLYIADGAIVPVTDSDIDLGTTSLRFKDTYTDTITTTGNVSVGGNLTVTGTTTFNGGTITMGDAATDNVVFGADVDSNIIPDDDDTYDLGSSSQQWRNLYIDGTAEIDTLAINGTTVTSTAAELNILDGVTSTAAELNILDGVTSTAAELNILDGVTASAADINLIDGITNGTVIASKAIITDANKDITGGRNITISGELDAATLDISGDADIDGTLEADAITIAGVTLAETISDTVGAMVGSNTETGISVTYDDSDNTLDFVIGADSIVSSMLDTNIDIAGTLDVTGVLTADTNATIAGTLGIAGGSTNGVAISQGAIAIKNGGAKSYIDLYCESSNAHYTRIEAAAHSAYSGNVTATLPVTTGTLAITSEIPTTEEIQDIVGAMVSSNTETNITVTYQDSDGTIDFVVDAAQPNITSLGTLTSLRVDDVVINGTTIGHADDTDLITVADGVVTVAGELDATSLDISGDADIDGTLEADAITVNGTALASVIAGTTVANATTAAVATTVTITDNESTNENNAIVFTAGGDLDGGNLGLESDGDLKYNPSTGTLSATNISVSGTLSTVDSVTMSANNAVVFEGATADAHETTLTVVDATADRTITLPNVSGTVPVLAAASNTQITSTPEELNILDGVTSTAAELNILDGVTSTAAELNILDGVTATATELNLIDGVTATTAELNILDGVTSTAAELNILDGVTSTTAELNALDGITAVVGELNALDIGSTAVGTAVASKAVILDSNKDYTGVRNFTISGELDAATLDISGNVDIDGVLETDNLTVGGAQGSDGQVLTSTGSGVGWEDAASGGASNVNGLSDAKTFGTASIMIGDASTGTIDAANYNTGLGVDIFAALTTGDNNSVVGYNTGAALTSGEQNTFIGTNAGQAVTTGDQNVALGQSALLVATTGDKNTMLGHRAGAAITTAGENTFVGNEAGESTTTGGVNTFVGHQAGEANTTGASNIFVGTGAGDANTTGSNNTFLGANAGGANTDQQWNVAVGTSALLAEATSGSNVAVGGLAMTTSNGAANNVAVGKQAGYLHTTGDKNAWVGSNAGFNSTTSSNNAGLGYTSLYSCTTGSELVGIGPQTLYSATTAVSCIAIGDRAFYSLVDSPYNVAIGYKSGFSFESGVSNEGSCTFLGDSSGRSVTSGKQNTFIGATAGYATTATTTGYRNTIVGVGAHAAANNGNLEVVLGFGCKGVGNGYTTIGSDSNRTYNQQGSTSWSAASDQRLKTDVVDEPIGLAFINDLRPVKFKWKKKKDVDSSTFPDIYEEGSDERVQPSEHGVDKHGFLAQELESTIANYSDMGDAGHEIFKQTSDGMYNAAPTALIPMLVKALQEADDKIDALVARVTTLEG